MERNLFDRKKRQFRYLSKRINQLLDSGKWDQLSDFVKTKLVGKLNALYRVLANYFSIFSLRKTLAAAAVFVTLPLISRSQAFDPPIENPFGYVPPATEFISPLLVDIDNDGDKDIITTEYEGILNFYENAGTAASPIFAASQLNPFGVALVGDLSFLSSADIDHDGDIDLFIGGEYGHIRFYKNTGTPTSPVFAAPQLDPFGYIPVNEFAIPTFADIDNDGDQDLFVGEYEGGMKYFKNTGTPALAQFASPMLNPFGITPAYYFAAPVFADFDYDGDLDLLEGEYYGNTRYFENTGTSTTPVFAAPLTNPFGIVQTDFYSFPAVADLDGDGDPDLIIAELYGDIQYFKNTDTYVGISDIQQQSTFAMYPNPASGKVVIHLKDLNPALISKIHICDLKGRLISENMVDAQLSTINLNQIPPGVYFVRLVGNGSTFTQKLIVR